MPSASPQDQRRLLDVQALDSRAQQLQHRAGTLPVLAEIAEIEGRANDLAEEALSREVAARDIQREVTKAEDDVQSVRTRAERDTKRLNSGAESPRDLQALQSEIEALTRRQSALEDIELEVMERLEEAEKARDAAIVQRDALALRVTELYARRDSELRAIEAELADIARERVPAVEGLPADLVALYDKIRAARGGVGAAALIHGACDGCHMNINSAELSRLTTVADDALVRCDECGRILVRGTAP